MNNMNNLNTMNLKSNNIEPNTNLNLNNINTFSNNNNDIEQNFGIHSQMSNKQLNVNNNNYLQNSLSSNTSGMIMPETNFTGYNLNTYFQYFLLFFHRI